MRNKVMKLQKFFLVPLIALAISVNGRAAEESPATETREPAMKSAQEAAAAEPALQAAEFAKTPSEVKININTATARELESLSGVGPKTADRIVAYRQQHGQFASVEQLLEVPGIGDNKLAAIEDMISLK
jgi:competence protein ComEA